MKRNIISAITSILVILLISLSVIGCGQGKAGTEPQIAEIRRGDINITVTADGNLKMPRQAALGFVTSGTVKYVVDEGAEVKEGTLLAKLDDTDQILALRSAQYDLQLALSELAETTPGCCTKFGMPIRYQTKSAAITFKQAIRETDLARSLLSDLDYYYASAKLRLAETDLESTIELLAASVNNPELYPEVSSDYPSSGGYTEVSPVFNNAVSLIRQDIGKLDKVLALMENGDYVTAETSLISLQTSLQETLRAIEKVVNQGEGFATHYPDTITSLDFIVFASENLSEMQSVLGQDDYDREHLAELMRMAQHELEISRDVLQNYELVYQHGLTLKAAQQYNLNVNKAIVALEKYKQGLMDTEILAPFDGTVVEVNIREHEEYGTTSLLEAPVAVRLVDTRDVEMDGVVDEIDILKVKVGQKAIITLDTPTGEDLTGEVTFISPFGTETTGIVNYKVTIKLDPTDIDLKGGLTATASIIVDSKENVLLIPNGAIQGVGGNFFTQVVVDQTKGQTERRPIAIGLQDGQYSEVISGLQEGDRVVVERTAR